MAKTFALLALKYWWPRQRATVRAFLARPTPNFRSRGAGSAPTPMCTFFELVAAGIFGPLKPTARGRTHILVLIDHHTRWVELIAPSEPTAELGAEAIFEH